VTALEIRDFSGYAFEDSRYLGVSHLVEETISKGTARRDGRALSDAFDEIGATHATFTGRETVGFSSLCLPEFLDRTIELHAEMICTPSFPDDACKIAIELAEQSLDALQDDPGELAKKLLHAQAYGQPLGRHPLGERETLGRIGPQGKVRRARGAGYVRIAGAAGGVVLGNL
jgi:zinc protease